MKDNLICDCRGWSGLTGSVLMALVLVSSAAGQVEIAGILQPSGLGISIDSIEWTIVSNPFPIMESTPGWGGVPDVEDTIQLEAKPEWPSAARVFYSFPPGEMREVQFDPLQPDTWYALPTGIGSDGYVMLRETLLVAIGTLPTARPFGRLSVSSNPLVGDAVLRWTDGPIDAAQLEILDRGGRVLARIESQAAGPDHVFVWRGQTAGPGVYLARVTSGRVIRSVKLVKVD